MKPVICVINLLTLCQGVLFTSDNVPNWNNLHANTKSVASEIYLTSDIEAGNNIVARNLALVDGSNFFNITSYAGYLTVNKEYNSNLWFWFFPAKGTYHLYEQNNYSSSDKPDWANESKPLILWLQGGPGSSSLVGLFYEIGPFSITDNGLNITENPYSWHQHFSMLFIDNPVGAGFSFTNNYKGYASNVDQIAKELYIGLVQFFKLFPWLQHVDFFIAGESFAGKYIPALGYEIYTKNKEQYFKINLQGLAIGNGFTDPYNMLHYSDFAYQTGLIDDFGKAKMNVFEHLAREYIDQPEAIIYWDFIIKIFRKETKYDNNYNIIQPREVNMDAYLTFINQSHIRDALHVGNIQFSPPIYVYYSLADNFMSSVMNLTEYLLDEGLRIMFYNGQLDFIAAYPLSENSFKKMIWSGTENYRYAQRRTFIVDDEVSGYIKSAKSFTEVVVLNAGHMVPYDQPKVAFELITRFIYKFL